MWSNPKKTDCEASSALVAGLFFWENKLWNNRQKSYYVQTTNVDIKTLEGITCQHWEVFLCCSG
ncbi:hypothetical protein EAI91_04985 [Lacticaseibacillus paracasei]|nr:hypothetical protein [Lacticaseibacillus paracasei]MCT3350496.1 hypothetical protein [Lacticaseibacillus paracasei]PTS57796.1 hypothetical protein DBQ61_05300 [Lactobacillus sp. DS22_6]RYT00185.1 hypothetical protein EAI91_04985 [Lacticaseibacillus paracasei]